jgi:hypothetical protein
MRGTAAKGGANRSSALAQLWCKLDHANLPRSPRAVFCNMAVRKLSDATLIFYDERIIRRLVALVKLVKLPLGLSP